MLSATWLCGVLAAGPASAAPTLSQPADGIDPPAAASQALGGAVGSGISTGQRHLDLLLEQQGAATGTPKPGGAAAAASMPREADLRQAIRADALSQDREKAKDKDARDAQTRVPSLGGEGVLRESESADPANRRTWEGDRGPAPGGERRSAGESSVSPIRENLRELMQFLRTHRIELFAGLALLGLAAVLVRLYSRAR